MVKIAIINKDKCRPNKCSKECKKICPPERSGTTVIDIEELTKPAKIYEPNCIGCNLCVKRCPFNAIKIINLPIEKDEPIFSYGDNSFRLYGVPILRKCITGIIGQNGIGKSTLISILTGKIKVDINIFKGTTMLTYMKNLSKMKIALKSQQLESSDMLVSQLTSDPIFDQTKRLNQLSGGELQLAYCFNVLNQDADIIILDEPSNFLDIEKRILLIKRIKEITNKYVIVVDHDISFLDYLADDLYIMYGVPHAYGIISCKHTTLEGINNYLNGYIPSQNVRFRDDNFTFPTADIIEMPFITSQQGISLQNINIIMGKNGSGKTTFLNSLSGIHKKQILNPSDILVGDYLDNCNDEICKLLKVKQFKCKLSELSGGELQRVEIAKCLSSPGNVYILDEPLANLDIEMRITIIKLLKKLFVGDKVLIMVEHDISMCFALGGQILLMKDMKISNSTIDQFLKEMDITMRSTKDGRPRINKSGSQLDTEQKLLGKYYL